MGFESTYHWEDPIYTGVIFGTVLATLISICYYSLISVCAYTSLFVLMCVAGVKLYTYVMVTFLKKDTVNPIAKYTGKIKLINTFGVSWYNRAGFCINLYLLTRHLFRNGRHHFTGTSQRNCK